MTAPHHDSSAGGYLRPPAPPESLFGIIGHPLGHSLSPALHTWNFQRLGLAAAYMRWDIAPKSLPEFMHAVHVLPVAGVSVTIPHKQAVIPFLDELSYTAERIGAVNTLFWRQGRLHGENTDITGFLSPLQGQSFDTALVLGAGGAARAVITGLQQLHVQKIHIANRSPQRAQDLAREFAVEALPWEERTSCACELLVNTTPLGMSGEGVAQTPWPGEFFSKGQTVYDLVYNPLQTRFLREAAEAGCHVLDGLHMFLGQAAEQCRLWTGESIPGPEGRALLEALLVRKS